jgi:hypothetical protein
MKYRNFFGFCILAFVAIIQSCATAYIPNKVNSPMFTDKGEAKIDLTWGMNGADVQIAYTPIKHLGIMTNGCFSTQTRDTSTTNFHKHAYGEIGVGWYNKISSKAVIEVYGGYGRGSSDTDWSIEEWTAVNNVKIVDNFTKYFIQPSIGIVKEKSSFSFTSRFSMIQMDIDRLESQYVNVNDIDLFWEPAFNFTTGKTVKFIGQFGISYPIIKLPEYSFTPKYISFSAGIEVHLGRNKIKSVEEAE